MKILYILPLLLFCNISFGQELPEIPMKNDIIYYSFLSKHTNQKKCLSKYLKEESYEEINSQTSIKLGEKLKGKYDKIYDPKDLVTLYFNPISGLNCVDTSKGGFAFGIPKGTSLFDMTIIGLVSGMVQPKPYMSIIKAEAILICSSKNEYELRFKKFMLEQMYPDGSSSNINLSEYYLALKNKEKLNKKEVNLFLDLEYVLKISIEALWESFNFIIENDELD
jgi:hypothetical protein